MTTPETTQISLQVDSQAGAAYLRFSANPVVRTVEFSDDIYVDLDQYGVAVGVELLDLGASVPLDELERLFHITSSALELLIDSIQWGAPQSHVGTSAPGSSRVQFSAGSAVRCPA